MSNHVRQHIDRWLLNQLSPEERHHIEEHLENCSYCREFFEQMETAIEEAGEVPETVTLPAGLLTRIKARAHQSHGVTRKKPLKAIIQWGVVAATAILIGIGIGELSYISTSEAEVIAAWQTEYQSLNTQLILLDTSTDRIIGRGDSYEN